MAGETIELLKNYDPAKMNWPAMHQQKIDGVPVRIIRQSGDVRSYTRQGERVTSIPHIERLCSVLLQNGESVIMELYVPDQTFKYISGKVRQIKPCPELRGWVFDFTTNTPTAGWWARRLTFKHRLEDAARIAQCSIEDLLVQLIHGVIVYDAEDAEEAHNALMLANPDAEGSVLHSMAKTFQSGKRCWGTQRMKPVPTIDLMVVGFEEAISENGNPLGMVGRVNAELTKFVPNNIISAASTIIGIGPGALTHTERKILWAEYKSGTYKPRIAEIRYMRDDSYDALRQPTFKQWRDDKKEADTHAS